MRSLLFFDIEVGTLSIAGSHAIKNGVRSVETCFITTRINEWYHNH
jgi:hypothetical protein